MNSGRWAVAWLRLVPLVWCPGACSVHSHLAGQSWFLHRRDHSHGRARGLCLRQGGCGCGLGAPRRHALRCAVTLEAHTTQVPPFRPPGSIHCPRPCWELGGTCGEHDLRLEGRELRHCHRVPVQPGHHHLGVLCLGGTGSRVPRPGIRAWCQREAVEKDVPSQLLQDAAVTVAEDVRTGPARLANGQAREAGPAAQL